MERQLQADRVVLRRAIALLIVVTLAAGGSLACVRRPLRGLTGPHAPAAPDLTAPPDPTMREQGQRSQRQADRVAARLRERRAPPESPDAASPTSLIGTPGSTSPASTAGTDTPAPSDTAAPRPGVISITTLPPTPQATDRRLTSLASALFALSFIIAVLTIPRWVDQRRRPKSS